MNHLKYALLGAGLFLILGGGCARKITDPQSRKIHAFVNVYDTSGVTQGVFSSRSVPGAQVTLSSANYSLTYSARTNEAGKAVFDDIIPDYYNIDVRRLYSEDSIRKYLGKTEEIVLVGSSARQEFSSPGDSVSMLLSKVVRAPFLISEIYYNGALPPPGFYFHDQFTEICNNTDSVKYLDGYVIGDGMYGYRDDPDFVHCERLYQFPGNGTDYPVNPGELIIIAQDGIDHTEIAPNSLDLSNADFEYYNPLANDVDNPYVTNMVQLHHEYGIDFLYSVMNDGIILAKAEKNTVFSYDSKGHILVPISTVVDGMEYKDDLHNTEYKYFGDVIDAGITGGIPMYQGKSVARKIFRIKDGRIQLQDNNNSSIDFQVMDTPSPGWIEQEN